MAQFLRLTVATSETQTTFALPADMSANARVVHDIFDSAEFNRLMKAPSADRGEPESLPKAHIAARLASPMVAMQIIDMDPSSGLREKLMAFRDALMPIAMNDDTRLYARFMTA